MVPAHSFGRWHAFPIPVSDLGQKPPQHKEQAALCPAYQVSHPLAPAAWVLGAKCVCRGRMT